MTLTGLDLEEQIVECGKWLRDAATEEEDDRAGRVLLQFFCNLMDSRGSEAVTTAGRSLGTIVATCMRAACDQVEAEERGR